MSRALWTPNQVDSQKGDTSREWERPFLQLPAPMPPMHIENAPVDEDEEESPRVIVIDI